MERLRGKSSLRRRDRRSSLMPVVAGFCLLLLSLGATPAHAATFTASLDSDTLTLGQSTTLSLTFEGGSPRNVPTPSVAGLQISQAGTSQNVSWVNGAMSSAVTVAFSVTPQRMGEFVIPAIVADVNGQRLTSSPLPLRVVKPSAPAAAQINSDSQIAFARLSLPEDKVYNGEVVSADLRLYFRQDTQLVRRPQLTGSAGGGVHRRKICRHWPGPNAGRQCYLQCHQRRNCADGEQGRPAPCRPCQRRPCPCGAIRQPFQRSVPSTATILRSGIWEQKQLSVATETVNAESLPLPTQNVPPNFNGAIGQYTMAVTAGPTNVAVGDPITIHVQISGRGDLGSLTLPDQSAWHDLPLSAHFQGGDHRPVRFSKHKDV